MSVSRVFQGSILTFLMLLWSGAVAAQQQGRSVAPRRDVQDAIVRVETYALVQGRAQLYQQGTGFVVSPQGHVMTAAHVIPKGGSGAIEIRITRRGDQPLDLRAQLVGEPDADSDTALVQVQGLGAVAPLCFADSEALRPGVRLVKYGFPRNGPIAPVTGTLSNRSGEVRPDLAESRSSYWWGAGPPRRMWLLSLPLLGGDSGGPVLTEEGFVAGIACCGVPADAHLGYMVPETAFVALRRRVGFSDAECQRAHQLASNPGFTRQMVGKWAGDYICETGNGRIEHTITVRPDGKLAVRECFRRDFRQGCLDYDRIGEMPGKERTLEMFAPRINAFSESYRLELTFDPSFRTSLGVYDGHRTCRRMNLQRVQ